MNDETSDNLRARQGEGEIVEIIAAVEFFGYLNRCNDPTGSVAEDLPVAAGEKHLESTGWKAGKHSFQAAFS